MLTKLEFQVQKYDSDVHEYLAVDKIFQAAKRFNYQLISVSLLTFLIFSLSVYFSPSLKIELIIIYRSYLANAAFYSSMAFLFVLFSILIVSYISSLHNKKLTKEVTQSSLTSSVVNMDNYKELVSRVALINITTNNKIKIFRLFFKLLNFISIILMLLVSIILVLCILNYYKYINNSTLDLLSYIKVINI